MESKSIDFEQSKNICTVHNQSIKFIDMAPACTKHLLCIKCLESVQSLDHRIVPLNEVLSQNAVDSITSRFEKQSTDLVHLSNSNLFVGVYKVIDETIKVMASFKNDLKNSSHMITEKLSASKVGNKGSILIDQLQKVYQNNYIQEDLLKEFLTYYRDLEKHLKCITEASNVLDTDDMLKKFIKISQDVSSETTRVTNALDQIYKNIQTESMPKEVSPCGCQQKDNTNALNDGYDSDNVADPKKVMHIDS